jgi:hypothetical protein
MPVEVKLDDVVQLKKPHACGHNGWRVYRVGADIGLICQGCERRQMLPRRKFEKAFKRTIESNSDNKSE